MIRPRASWRAVVGVVVLTMTVPVGVQSTPDFSGQWTAESENAGASAAPGAPRGTWGSGWGTSITIIQDAKQLVVEHLVFTRYDIQPQPRTTYALDGSETRNTVMIGHTAQVRRSRAVWKNQTLEIVTTYPEVQPGGGASFSTEVVQRLTLDTPTVLVIEVTRSTSSGTGSSTTRAVYTKNSPR